MEDCIEALEALHKPDSEELHFRFIGTAKNRQFIVNVQFGSLDAWSSEKLSPVEYDFMMAKVLDLILKHLGDTSNPALH